MLVNPGFNFRASKVTDYFPRCITPPYVSSTAEIRHRRLDRSSDRFIVLASDGLTDMFSPEGGDPILSEENADKIAHVVGAAGAVGGNLSLRLLREGFGGDNLDKCSRNLTAEMEGGAWMDDTTVIVLHL